MPFFEIVFFAALCALAWFWFDTVKAREVGRAAAKLACRREGVQLLDDTVAFRSLRPTRDDEGRMALRRVYDFEYSADGNDRYRGSVMLLGREVVMLDVSSHRRTTRVIIN
ncbi:DUF3301 domain-containing protein [Pseudazoarcus pumilus]|uniref:DUF3301 domain-containing protein n=1 Tax=Pseudazoarcus pumilus TaxID=2067960 RepID=A0A2I6S766_9RHOO|nr:DUF3301 domain-containing protein [Pseudazoarcus pumilus]AUN95082.1 DUF3301 domain-containing protein [Pseudazoarcus pumilus]